MDRDQQELKSIAFTGILKKTFKFIYKEKMIFTKITPFILPLTIMLVVYPLFIAYYELKLLYNSRRLVHDIITVLLTVAGFMLAFIFFLLPTSAIVYTMACIYTAKQFTFKTILQVVPKAWIKLMVTFAIQFLIMLAYNFFTILVLLPPFIWLTDDIAISVYLLIISPVLYLVGFVYIGIIWSLANVVTLLEDLKGYGAIKKSEALLRGKMLLACALFALVGLPVVAMILFGIVGSSSYIYSVCLTKSGRMFGQNERITLGRLWHETKILKDGLILLSMVLILPVLVVLGLVIQTIFYFVCKSYHHEIIDKSYLANYLENVLPAAAYVPDPVEKIVQLEHSDV